MDVYEACANMIAFSEFVVAAAKHTYGPQVEARADVSGFRRGSFETDLIFHVAGASATILSAISPSQLWDVVKEAIRLWKHLKGQPPSKVEHNNSQEVTVTNNDGQIIQVQSATINLVFSDKGADAVEKFVRKALDSPGMDAVEIGTDKQRPERITQNEAKYFVPVAPVDHLIDGLIDLYLIIEAPVFKDGNKWRFSDGQQSFFANIEDREFLAKVNAGERFGKGDLLHATVRITQEQTGLRITAERSIVKVHEHKTGPRQITIDENGS